MDNELQILGPFSLRQYIEFLRNELIQTGLKMGLNHKETIQASEELDYFINVYEKMKKQREQFITDFKVSQFANQNRSVRQPFKNLQNKNGTILHNNK